MDIKRRLQVLLKGKNQPENQPDMKTKERMRIEGIRLG